MSDKEIYQVIADELKTKNVDAALWIQAKETAGGDIDKTEATYIRLRFLDMLKSSCQPPKPAVPTNNAISTTGVEVKPKVDELARMRTELAKKLLSQGKHSLYSILKLQPDASDAVIATAISDLESRNLDGSGINPAEFKYAKGTLSNPNLREQYDRQLFGSVANIATSPYRSYAYEETDSGSSWWESGKTSTIIGVLLLVLVGYLGLDYLKERNKKEIQTVAVESQKEVMQTISDTTQMRTQAELDLRAEALRLAAERQSQEMDYRNRTAERNYEQQRLAQERQLQYEQQRKQSQQELAESLRVRKEKQYWACMNQQLTVQLSQRNGNSYDASARCAMFR